MGAVADYKVEHPNLLEQILAVALAETELVFDPFFVRQSNLQKLVEYYEENVWAGGTAHWVKLLATLFHMGRDSDVKKLIGILKKEEIAPITQSMIDFITNEISK